MIPYLILLSIPALFALNFRARIQKDKFYFVLLIFVLFVGLRYQVGADWGGYSYIHRILRDEDFAELWNRSEPLSYMLFWISEHLGWDMLLSNLVAALILIVGVFSFARRTLNPWLAVLAATPYLIIAFGMTGIRQVMGVGVILFVLSKWDRISIYARGAGVVVASLFHSSALIGGILVIMTLRVPMWMKLVAGTAIGALGLYVAQSADIYADSMQDYQRRYLDDTNSVISPGSMFHVGLILLPASIGYWYRLKLKHLVHDDRLLWIGIVGGFCLVPLNLLSSTAASRLMLYFYFLPMMVYPALTLAFGRSQRRQVTQMIVLAHFVILAAWFQFGNNSFAHIPYRNVLFEDEMQVNSP